MGKTNTHLQLIEDSPERPSDPWSRYTQAARSAAASLVVLATLSVLMAAYAARAVVFPLVLAMLIAFPLRPVVRLLRRAFIPQFLGAAICEASAVLVLAVAAWAIIVPGARWLDQAPHMLQELEFKLRDVKESVAEINRATQQVEELTEGGEEDERAVEVEIRQPTWTSFVFNHTSNLMIGMMITASLLYLLLVFGDGLLDTIIRLMPTVKDEKNVRLLCQRIEQTISRYLLTYTLINIGLGVLIGTGLYFMGMPNPVLWGVMAGLLNYVPFVGLVVGTAIVSLVAVMSFDSLSYAMIAPAIYLGANGLEANVVTPALLGKSMQLNIIMIFLFIVLWGWMWGVGGALIAVPLLAAFKITCDHFPQTAALGKLLGDSGHRPAEATADHS